MTETEQLIEQIEGKSMQELTVSDVLLYEALTDTQPYDNGQANELKD